MARFIDLLGLVFGRLVVTARLENCPRGSAVWLCNCSCGKGHDVIAKSTTLKLGHTKSCGCLKAEKSKLRLTKHGLRGHSLYHTWLNMRERCNNPKNKDYKYYGGKGVKVCEQWGDFARFLSDMGEKPLISCSIERIDGRGDYCKSNCKWATPTEQARNTSKRSNNVSGQNGVHLTHIHGVPYWTATWVQLDGIEQRKRFNVITLGDNAAYLAACTHRETILKELNALGAGYSAQHGK